MLLRCLLFLDSILQRETGQKVRCAAWCGCVCGSARARGPALACPPCFNSVPATFAQVAFLKDLSGVWQQFDERLLQHRVLPPVVAEMRSDVVALAALPLVLSIMGRMKPDGFAARWV